MMAVTTRRTGNWSLYHGQEGNQVLSAYTVTTTETVDRITSMDRTCAFATYSRHIDSQAHGGIHYRIHESPSPRCGEHRGALHSTTGTADWSTNAH